MRSTSRLGRTLIPIAALTLGACATTRYSYVPASLSGQNREKTERGRAYYPVPPDAPTGNLRVMSGGVVKLKPDAGGRKIPAMHVRMIVSNQSSATPWTVDPKAQLASFPSHGPSHGPNHGGAEPPVFAQDDGSSELTVKQGEIKSVDLYFKAPDDESSSRDIPEFDFRWQIKIGTRVVQDTTSFDRVPTPTYGAAPYSSYYYPPGWYYPYGYGPGVGLGLGFGWWNAPPILVEPVPMLPPQKPVIVH